jgi:SNF2 family DNA or RNA helicase
MLGLHTQVQLRRYQQEGINWLSFLRRFGLSGVLADDMGLGKTLQATTIMACSAAERRAAAATGQQQLGSAAGGAAIKQEHAAQAQLSNGDQQLLVGAAVKQEAGASQAAAAGQSAGGACELPASRQHQQQPVLLPSLVVCPSTLVGHWAHEVNKYVEPSVLRPLAVSGTPTERAAAVARLQGPEGFNVVVISYESLRSDVEWAAGLMWDYVILDEGHVIRSTKSKLSQVS